MIEHPIKGQGHSKTKKLFILIALIGATVTIVNYHNLYQKKLDVKGFQSSASRNIPPFPAKYHRGFLVSSSKCKIIDLDPFNDEAMQFHSAKRYQDCTKRPLLTYVTKEDNVATLHINTSLQSAYSLKNIRCCYSNITRDSEGEYPDTTINISMCQEFTNSVLISQDPVTVNCIDDDGLIYENVHIAVTMTKSIEDKITKSKKRRPISILMIGIDSVSRLNFIRTMPHTYNYVETNHWIPLLGFNKKGDNTFPNMMAILTGLDVSLFMEDKICNPYIFGELDSCPMIWKNYSKLGYVTAYAEDEPYRVAFNYAKGFKTPPTDYYFKPYVLATQKLSKGYIDGLSYCTGPETAGERIMNLAKDFSATFKSYPYLGLFWMNSFSHDKINSPGRMDLKVKHFLEILTKERITDDSIIVFFSDHGIRYGDILLYNTGWHEERLPFIYFSFPTWFKRKYPRLLNNFKANMNRLTSPYDFYMTLQHVLLLEGKISEFKPSIACPTCKSFFDEIPHNRSCKDAGIPTHYCTCQGYLEVRLSQDVAQHAAQLLIDEVHSRIKDIPSCLRYKLLRVRRTAVSQNSLLENETYLLMSIETIPTAIFEATFIVSGDISRKDISLAENKWISRLDPTGGNDWCTKNFKIYCFCPKKH